MRECRQTGMGRRHDGNHHGRQCRTDVRLVAWMASFVGCSAAFLVPARVVCFQGTICASPKCCAPLAQTSHPLNVLFGKRVPVCAPRYSSSEGVLLQCLRVRMPPVSSRGGYTCIGASMRIGEEQEAGVASKNSPPMYKHPNFDEPFELDIMPEAYAQVLGILQDLDRNGSWPNTSRRRAELLKNTSRRETPGDSFTIGLFPPPLRLPHANAQLPGLLEALLRLERAIRPNRPVSTTITVNRHAQFRPHRDSGAGAGQSTSLIVGLGDYIGGALMVQGKPHDIRYKPLEFDGWRELHWTRPFRGERFSLVWYTPQGLEGARDALQRGSGWAAAAAIASNLPPVAIVRKSLASLEAAATATAGASASAAAAAAAAAAAERARGITSQRFSMVPPNVNFRSRISLLAIERLDRVGAYNVQVPLRSASQAGHEGFQGRVLFDSDAPFSSFLRLQLCESVRVVVMHADYVHELGVSPSIANLCQWIVDEVDWPLALAAASFFGNAGPEARDFNGFHVRCKTSAGRLHTGASQEVRTQLALAVYRRFGWAPVIRRSDADLEILVTFHKSGMMVEIPVLVQKEVQWEEQAAEASQLAHFDKAIKELLPPIVPRCPRRAEI